MNRKISSSALQVRTLLERASLSQRGAAKQLDIAERTMRYYVSGDKEVPRVVLMALEYLTGDPAFFKRLEFRARLDAGCSCGAFVISTYEGAEAGNQRVIAGMSPGSCDACAEGATGEAALRLVRAAGFQLEQRRRARQRGEK